MPKRRRSYPKKPKTIFRSKFEMSIASALKGAGVPFQYETLVLDYLKPATYTPDFLIMSNNIILEAKGFWAPSDRTKHLLVRDEYPELDIRFVFQNARLKLSKKSKTSYGDWCDKHGFQWCDKGVIPKAWLNLKP